EAGDRFDHAGSVAAPPLIERRQLDELRRGMEHPAADRVAALLERIEVLPQLRDVRSATRATHHARSEITTRVDPQPRPRRPCDATTDRTRTLIRTIEQHRFGELGARANVDPVPVDDRIEGAARA